MDASVIICTHNRAESLRQTLETFRDLIIPRHIVWELVVVDNNSTDHTSRVCEEFLDALPLRRVCEPQQGLSHARNRGIEQTTGSLILFTDDDVDVDPHWLMAYCEAARASEGAMFFGGPIEPLWESEPPYWVVENDDLLKFLTMRFDLGPVSRDVEGDLQDYFWGANMAFRRVALESIGGFNSEFGYAGKDLTPSEEFVVMRRLALNGAKGRYVAEARVRHRIPKARLTEAYLRRRCKGDGMVKVRLYGTIKSNHVWFGAPRCLWRSLVEYMILFAGARISRSSKIWLPYEMAMAEAWGRICEHRRQYYRQRRPLT